MKNKKLTLILILLLIWINTFFLYKIEKIEKKDKFNLSNLYWFDLSSIQWKMFYEYLYFPKIALKWTWNEQTVMADLYNYETINLKINNHNIYFYKNILDYKLNELKDIFDKKTKITNENWISKFNIRWWFVQVKPFNEEFINDKNWKIKWIWFYCFEWQDAPWTLKYKIYSVKDKVLLEVDIDIIWELSYDETQKYVDKFMKNTDSDFDIEKYKEIFFKNWYFEDENKSKEYWINIKNEIEFYKEIVKNS